MWAIVDGKIGENTTVYEASSGNTAASEAYMCRLIGVKFIAIVGIFFVFYLIGKLGKNVFKTICFQVF